MALVNASERRMHRHARLVATPFPSLIIGVVMTFSEHDIFPANIQGARIVNIGHPDELQGTEGGLVIEYEPSNTSHVIRLVLGYTELGMWVERMEIA